MRSLLTIIPYPHLFPPRNGGHLRAFYVLRELARSHQVHAIVMQPRAEFAGVHDGYSFPESVRLYSPSDNPPTRSPFRYLGTKFGPAVQSRVLRRSWKEPASSVILNTHHLLRDVLRSNRIDAVVFTELSSLAAAPLISRVAPGALRIMDMHNVDHLLLEQEAKALSEPTRSRRADLNREIARLRSIEASLSRHVDGFWATSNEDENTISELNNRVLPGWVIPNGVDVDMRPFDDREAKASRETVLFCGSLDYLPNRDALEWFHQSIWPEIRGARPSARLVVVGRGLASSDFISVRSDPSVELVGEVTDVVPYYREAGVCVVPLRMGSGTRLKILEAMSLGNPVVSTSIGAMGLDTTDESNIAIADDATQFASKVLLLMADGRRFHQMRSAARTLVEERFDWRVIGRQMDEALNSMLGHGA